ncbi:glycosyltransferase family 4 protein [Indiicoccus explosivorum]|uniref:glycosyltransferase family 4 protein n=1 Tax=Indiicoccus explosivorum TaxID=1917864 RepID=UPI0011858DBA|nr:glycosyltransferase family 4 protein [Indiicoccus explosivorum]
MEKWICSRADVVTAVSEGYLDKIWNGLDINGQVITNGFDQEDLEFLSGTTDRKKFPMAYTGVTYRGKRDLTPIFMALRQLIDEGKVDEGKIAFRYAGSESEDVRYQAAKAGLADLVESKGMVPRKEALRLQALRLQAESELLVVATWNEERHTGVLPGKFLEYMMFRKPIVAVVNGKVNDSEIGSMLREYDLGFCYEAANDSRDFRKLKLYLYEQYTSFLETGAIFLGGNQMRLTITVIRISQNVSLGLCKSFKILYKNQEDGQCKPVLKKLFYPT